jgi:hypothetical protein
MCMVLDVFVEKSCQKDQVSRAITLQNQRTGTFLPWAQLGIIILLCAKFHPNPSINVGAVAISDIQTDIQTNVRSTKRTSDKPR